MSATQDQSLEDMLDGTEPAPAAEQQPEPAATGDNTNALAPPADATPPAETRDDAPHVPRRALEDERRKRQELERQIATLQQQVVPARQQPPPQQMPAQPPDMFADPDGYTAWVMQNAYTAAVQRAQHEAINRELNRSERRARKKHGDDIVDAALQAATRIGINQSFVEEDDPYDALLDWFGSYQVAANPQAAREKLKAEIMAEMGITLPNGQSRQPAQQKAPVPRSLASTASGQPRDDRGRFQGPTPLEDLLP